MYSSDSRYSNLSVITATFHGIYDFLTLPIETVPDIMSIFRSVVLLQWTPLPAPVQPGRRFYCQDERAPRADFRSRGESCSLSFLAFKASLQRASGRGSAAYCGHDRWSRRPCRGHFSVEFFVQQLGGTACNLGSYSGALSFCAVLCAVPRTLMLRTLFWTIWTNLNQRPLKRCCNNHAS